MGFFHLTAHIVAKSFYFIRTPKALPRSAAFLNKISMILNTASSTLSSWKEEDLIISRATFLRYKLSNCKLLMERGYLFSRNHTTELFIQLLLSLDRGLIRIWLFFYYTQLLLCLAKVNVSLFSTAFPTLESWKEEDLFFSINFSLAHVFDCKMLIERGYYFSRNHTTELGITLNYLCSLTEV